jgi:hypothetical protein
MTTLFSLAAGCYSPGELRATLDVYLAAVHARAFRELLCRKCGVLGVIVWILHWCTGLVPATGAWVTTAVCVLLIALAWQHEHREWGRLQARLPRRQPNPGGARVRQPAEKVIKIP